MLAPATASLPVLSKRTPCGDGADPAGPLVRMNHGAASPKVLIVMNASFGEGEAILGGIARFQSEHGAWDIFVDNEARAESSPEWIAGHPWHGVISRTTTPRLVDACAAKRLPLVDLNDCPAFPRVPKIRPDNHAVGHMAAEDLHERGYRHLYFCGYTDWPWSLERRDGFFEALSLLDCSAGEFSLPHGSGLRPADNARTVQQIAEWLKSLPLPAGIMAAHDLRGRQVLDAARQAGLVVPEELAVIGVNNEQVRCELAVPPLSSVATDTFRTGYLAAEELARRMRGELGIRDEVLVEPVKIVTRRSTDSLVIKDQAVSLALAIIRREACNGIKVEDVARQAATTRARLEHGFRFFLGRSPQAEIRRIRIARIKQLLTETDLPLKQIAVLTGFEHVEYLNVSFKRDVGETPGRFRLLARKATAGGRRTSPAEVTAVAPAA